MPVTGLTISEDLGVRAALQATSWKAPSPVPYCFFIGFCIALPALFSGNLPFLGQNSKLHLLNPLVLFSVDGCLRVKTCESDCSKGNNHLYGIILLLR